jgi:hypothetical protein
MVIYRLPKAAAEDHSCMVALENGCLMSNCVVPNQRDNMSSVLALFCAVAVIVASSVAPCKEKMIQKKAKRLKFFGT